MARARHAAAETRRLEEADWVRAGLDVLAQSGVDAVRVEILARKLEITKGSFYWHFKDRAGLLAAMLATWQRQATVNVIDRLERSREPAQGRLRRLIDLPTTGNRAAHGASVEMAIRLWAKSDPQARRAVADIDRQRLEYIRTLVPQGGAEAEARAYLYYAYMLAEAFISTPLSPAAKIACDAWLGQTATNIDIGMEKRKNVLF